jgi:hypothetical protein
MLIISHRANVDGPCKHENTIGQVGYALSMGFYVEVDVWQLNDGFGFRMGHDEPLMRESAPLNFLQNDKIFCHCKDEHSFDILKNYTDTSPFKHNDEKQVIVMKNGESMIWKHSNNRHPSGKKDDIYVFLGDDFQEDLLLFGGICTDYPIKFKEYLKGCNEKH